MTIITTKHTRDMGYCSSGVRNFCLKHQIDYRKFIKHGIDEADLIKINDAMSLKLIYYAKSKETEHG